MQAANTAQRARPQLKRRSSIELRVSEEATPCNKGKFKFLAVIRSSTLALVTSLFCAYAWFVTIGVGSTYLTFSLMESAQETLLSMERDQVVFQDVLETLRTETELAMRGLELSRSTCRIQNSLFEESFLATVPLCQLELDD